MFPGGTPDFEERGGADAYAKVDWNEIGKRNPSGRVGAPEDIAGLAIFLSSRAGQFVVGQVIACDGGVVGTS